MTPSLDHVLHELAQMRPLVPTYIHLIISVIFPIYTASHASLTKPPSAAPPEKSKKNSSSSDGEDEEEEGEETSPTIETLRPSDVILFPILAGATLASLYFILKWLQDPAVLNYYLGLYFAVVGLFFNIKFFADGLTIVRSYLLPNQYSYQNRLWRVSTETRCFVPVIDADKDGETARPSDSVPASRKSPLPGSLSIFLQRPNSILWSTRELLYTKLRMTFQIHKLINFIAPVSVLDIISTIVAIPLVYYHTFIDKPWFLTNILGFSFCYGSLQYTTPGTSSTGSLLLSALFFYDIYFVFYTPMMVTVATKLDVPIKLLFPRPDGCIPPVGAEEGSEAMQEYLQCVAKKKTMAMIGLGDIVIPGLMMAFALRFDLNQHYRKLAKSKTKTQTLQQESDHVQQPRQQDQVAKSTTAEPSKIPYQRATGSWGEHFWTTQNLQPKDLSSKRFTKTYFHATIFGYVLGLMATVTVMQVFQHAQPALLYLVPGVLAALWGTALVKGDLGALWRYSEVHEEESQSKSKSKSPSDEKKTKKQVQDGNEKESNVVENKKIDAVEGSDEKEKSKGPENTSSDIDAPKPDSAEVGVGRDDIGTEGDGSSDGKTLRIVYFDLSVQK